MAGHIIYVHDTVPAPPEAVWEVLIDVDRSPLGRLAWEMFGGLSYGHTRRMFEHDIEDIAAQVRKRAVPA